MLSLVCELSLLPPDISEKLGSLVSARTGEAAHSLPLETELVQCCANSLAVATFCNPGSESVMREMSGFAGEVSLHLGGVSRAHFRQSLVKMSDLRQAKKLEYFT